MIKFENAEVYNFNGAIRNMRNSWNSWDKSDSLTVPHVSEMDMQHTDDLFHDYNVQHFYLGAEDKKLALKLIKAGTDHAKFMRQILMSVDIVAPLYFFKQFDQYKISTVTNSTSTMHTVTKYPITADMFSVEDLEGYEKQSDNVSNETDRAAFEMFEDYLKDLETIRKLFVETKDKKYWRALIQMIPDSINQRRGVTLNYQVLQNIYHSRRLHRLYEWRVMCAWIETLPYSFLITGKVE